MGRPPMRILIVCSGNTCRSPMAGGLLGQVCSEMGREVEVETAGLWPGGSLATKALEAMREVGIDISREEPKALTARLVEWADVILCVDRRYGGEVEDRFPEASDKVAFLHRDISDPYCGSLSRYRECRDLLCEALADFVRALPWAGCRKE